jgi:hypothetical protein
MALLLAACGGGNGGGNSNPSNPGAPLILSGWYGCGGSGADTDLQQTPIAVVATQSGNIYGRCETGTRIAAYVSGNYTGKTFPSTLTVSAQFSNFIFYDPATSQQATYTAGGQVPPDTYSASGTESSNNPSASATATTAPTNMLDYLTLTESGSASRSGAINGGVTISTSLPVQGFEYPCWACTKMGAPGQASGFAGSYTGVNTQTFVSTDGSTSDTVLAGIVAAGSAITVDAAGNISGTTPVGTLTAYEASSDAAEYTGTLTTASGAIPVQGVYLPNDYQLSMPLPNVGTSNTIWTSYYPLALFIKGPGFEYEILLQPNLKTNQ